MADAAGTTPDRVAVQCVHQHDAPFVCLDANHAVTAQPDLPPIVDVSFFRKCLDRARDAVRQAVQKLRPVTHVAVAQARVQQVASNRRILGSDGRVWRNRSVAPSGDDLRSLPDGVIDPWLKTIALYDQTTRLVACHYYAVHPISYCCQEGRVSSEFVGWARRMMQQHDGPDTTHIYFTGCAGNQNTGKYNSSAIKENRRRLAERMLAAMQQATEKLRPEPIESIVWRTERLLPPARREFSLEGLREQIADRKRRVVHRNRPAFTLAWLERLRKRLPLELSALHINQATALHLPGEPFVEYQLRAQVFAPDRFVAVAGYGDGGPWYIPTAEAYAQGGYEVNVAFSDPRIDPMLTQCLFKLLEGPAAS
ncbi:MAG: hypothetical protein GXP27_09755 [Planctomycetes bacterium]|nr:hypothetical protein [Planctomycetota bacterium]